MPEDPLNPEDCLPSLAAEALQWALHRPLFPDSLELMAVANGFVMLGLLAEPLAEAVLADHRSALEREGFGDAWGVTEGELTVRPAPTGTCSPGWPGRAGCARCRWWWPWPGCAARPRLPLVAVLVAIHPGTSQSAEVRIAGLTCGSEPVRTTANARRSTS